jgi:hypothetical protein
MDNKNDLFICRINRTRVNPYNDYKKCKNQINQSNIGYWDSDSKNAIKSGNFLAFIIDSDTTKQLEIFKVTKVNTNNERDTEWKDETPYMNGNGTNSVSHRNQIELSKEHNLPPIYNWFKFKKELNYAPNKESWIPRGTMRVSKKELIPFNIEN